MLSQLEGSGRGDLASYNGKSYNDLHALLAEKPFGREPLTTAEDWLTELMHRNEMLGKAEPYTVWSANDAAECNSNMSEGPAMSPATRYHFSLCRAAIRIMEVRAAYCQTDFEWEQFQRVANQEIQDSNVRLMRKHASEVFEKAYASEDTNDPKT